MGLFARIDRHSDLVQRMANTLGADLVETGQCGTAPETALRSAIYSCMTCKQAAACEAWLAAHADGASETPDYCRNKALLERLATS